MKMEALKAGGLPPFSVLAGKTQPKKTSSLAIISPLKNRSFSLSRTIHGSLVLLSSVLTTGIAKSLTYEEALQQTGISAPSDFDFAGAVDSVISFAAENPTVVGGGAAALVVPLVISQLISNAKPWGVESAKVAYAKLGDDPNAQILDIRAPAELRQVGGPDVKGLKKKAAAVAYNGGDKPGFLKKLALKFKEPENTTLFILDKFDGNSELVAELVTANGFKAAYAIKDGAEGPRGWMNSGLPWIPPKKLLSLDLSDLTDAFGEGSDAVPLTVGVAAAAGLGLLAFTEVETVLQLLGSAALIQFLSKKLLFAEDRKQTVQQIEEFLNTKVAPKELVDDIQEIGKALLPPNVVSNTLPAPAEGGNSASMKSESTAETNTVPPKAEPTPEVNSVTKAEVEQESLPVTPRPLSPYPNYPDFKPPSSPMPSQP